jgi:hypothetical protein
MKITHQYFFTSVGLYMMLPSIWQQDELAAQFFLGDWGN